ncbi:armadillo-type protein [Entophlyctis helioformis]|nr:armadillo-type protein [Entophlyctis helioformis]
MQAAPQQLLQAAQSDSLATLVDEPAVTSSSTGKPGFTTTSMTTAATPATTSTSTATSTSTSTAVFGGTHLPGPVSFFTGTTGTPVVNSTHSGFVVTPADESETRGASASAGATSGASVPPPKPRRRLKDTGVDHASGLDVLIQKTKAISLQPEAGHEPLVLGDDEEGWMRALQSHRASDCLWGIRKIRKYVCGDGSEGHAENLIQWKALDRLIWFLAPEVPEDIQFETLWILTNVAAGPTPHTAEIVRLGFLPHLVNMLRSTNGGVRTQAAWALGNIIGDREGFRDLVLQAGALTPLLHIWEGSFPLESQRKEAFRIAMWVVDNMCRYKPDWHQMSPAFHILPSVLNQQDPYLLKECCWAIARILHQSGRHPAIDTMITEPLCHRLVELLRPCNMLTTHPILRALINLASSRNRIHHEWIVEAGLFDQTELMLQPHYLPESCRSSLQVFVLQILGNLATSVSYARQIAERHRTVERMVALSDLGDVKELSDEASICIRNLAYHRDLAISPMLVYNGCVPALLNYIGTKGPETKGCLAAVEALGYVLEVGDRVAASAREAIGASTSASVLASNASSGNGSGSEADSPAPVNPYLAGLAEAHGVDELIKVLVGAMGHDVDKMDEDGPVDLYSFGFGGVGDGDDEEDSDDDDDDGGYAHHGHTSPHRQSGGGDAGSIGTLGGSSSSSGGGGGGMATGERSLYSMLFDGQKAFGGGGGGGSRVGGGRHRRPMTTLTIRQQVATKVHGILIRWFADEFSHHVQTTAETSKLLGLFGGMSVDGRETAGGGAGGRSDQQDAFMDLVDHFGALTAPGFGDTASAGTAAQNGNGGGGGASAAPAPRA